MHRPALNAPPRFPTVIILFHGYTACPQQFFEWAGRLSQKGYDVLLPLNPGHGIEPVKELDSDGNTIEKFVTEKLPKVEESVANPLDPATSAYANLAVVMNEIASGSRGDKFVGGISVGGAIATHAVNLAPTLYKKAAFCAPFYAIDAFYAREFVNTLNGLKYLDGLDPAVASAGVLLDKLLKKNDTLAGIYLLLKNNNSICGRPRRQSGELGAH